MAKHGARHGQRNSRRSKRTRRTIKGGAISAVYLVAGGMVLAPTADPAASVGQTDVSLAAASVVYLDGTNYPYGSERMGTELNGAFTGYSTQIYVNTETQYPGTLGLYSGLGKPTGDQSVAAGQSQADDYIKNSPDQPVTVVGYSLGAVAASHELAALGTTYPTGTNFVLIADAESPNGGILARMPAGTYIPLLGITGGGATSADGAPVVLVSKQYDGVTDAPAYIGNPLADFNALLGVYYLHSDYYTVDVDPANPDPSKDIVTTGGNMTLILVPAPAGQLPIFMPLASLGVPQPILVALDPVTRAVIETGYTSRDADPSVQVRFQLLPPPSAWAGDVQSVAIGAATTAQLLPGAILGSLPAASSTLGPTPVGGGFQPFVKAPSAQKDERIQSVIPDPPAGTSQDDDSDLLSGPPARRQSPTRPDVSLPPLKKLPLADLMGRTTRPDSVLPKAIPHPLSDGPLKKLTTAVSDQLKAVSEAADAGAGLKGALGPRHLKPDNDDAA